MYDVLMLLCMLHLWIVFVKVFDAVLQKQEKLQLLKLFWNETVCFFAAIDAENYFQHLP